jgi:alkylation response protein AidB-like acyl-CoA dehydrogenase
MDFNYGELADDLRSLVETVFFPSSESAADDTAPAGKDWGRLTESGVLQAFLPAANDGEDAGAEELVAVVRELGLGGARVPAVGSIPALMVMVQAAAGLQDAAALLAAAGAGKQRAALALREAGRSAGALGGVRASTAAGGLVLDGTKTLVLDGAAADWLIVSVLLDGAARLVLVPAAAAGVNVVPDATGSILESATVVLNSVLVPAHALLREEPTGTGPALVDLANQLQLLALVALASGHLEAALRLTAKHINTREQFGHVLAKFQAVAMTISDVYIAHSVLKNLVLGSAWRVQNQDPQTAMTLASAALIVTEEVQSSLLGCQQLHGGLGLDATYPLHRHFSAGFYCAQWLGGADGALEMLGDSAAAQLKEDHANLVNAR